MYTCNRAYSVHGFHCSGCECYIMAGATSRVNVALNRPTWQSSMRCDGMGCHGANKSNDGSMVTSHFVQPSCTHTQNGGELNPWIAIDLGGAIYVDSVDVTSRGDCNCGA